MKYLLLLSLLISCCPKKAAEVEKPTPDITAEEIHSPKFKVGECVANSMYEFEIPEVDIDKVIAVGKRNYLLKYYSKKEKRIVKYEKPFEMYEYGKYRRVVECTKRLK